MSLTRPGGLARSEGKLSGAFTTKNVVKVKEQKRNDASELVSVRPWEIWNEKYGSLLNIITDLFISFFPQWSRLQTTMPDTQTHTHTFL